jgi:hypothetical protein
MFGMHLHGGLGGFGAPTKCVDVLCYVCWMWFEQETKEMIFYYLAWFYLGDVESEE